MQPQTAATTDTTAARPWLPYLGLVITLLAISMSPILVRWANVPGPVAAFYRMGIAATVMVMPLSLQLARRPHIRRWSHPGTRYAILAGLFFSGDVLLWSTGVMLSGASVPTLLANTAPVWVALGAMLFLGERLHLPFWLGLALAVAGAAVILAGDLQQSRDIALGSMLGLGAGFFYGSYFLLIQRSRETMDAVTTYSIMVVTGAVVLFLASQLMGFSLLGYAWQTYAALLALGLIAQLLGQLMVSYVLGHLPASIVSPTLLLQPVTAAILAAILLGEVLGAWQLVGGLAVLAGIFVVHWARTRP